MPPKDFLGSFSDFLSKFGIVPALISLALVVLLYLLWKWLSLKIDLEKDGKDREIKRLNDLLLQKEKEHGDSLLLVTKQANAEKEQLLLVHQNDVSNMERLLGEFQASAEEDLVNSLKNLQVHPLFSNIEYWISVKIPGIKITHPVKRNIFIDFLSVTNNLTKDLWQEFLMTVQFDRISNQALRDAVTKLMTKITKATRDELVECGIPRPVVHKLNETANLSELFIFAAWDSICDSNIYEDNCDKVYALLNLRLQINEVLLHEVAARLEAMNGDLDNLTYNRRYSR